MTAAVAALAAAQAEASGSSSSGSRMRTSPSSPITSAAAAVASAAQQSSSLRRSSVMSCAAGSCSTAGSGSGSSKLLASGRCTCSPTSCRHSSPPSRQRLSAAELLLPPSLQHKLEAVLNRAQRCACTSSSGDAHTSAGVAAAAVALAAAAAEEAGSAAANQVAAALDGLLRPTLRCWPQEVRRAAGTEAGAARQLGRFMVQVVVMTGRQRFLCIAAPAGKSTAAVDAVMRWLQQAEAAGRKHSTCQLLECVPVMAKVLWCSTARAASAAPWRSSVAAAAQQLVLQATQAGRLPPQVLMLRLCIDSTTHQTVALIKPAGCSAPEAAGHFSQHLT
ncbi:hypothetical protein COO60DRAFT_476456 [Scenedesmus sp. NREL 46B-D3]|nr:hypothetical protein COO60DRAFT_476456 [Scenedesmus sp. NREL 46B-D3]